MNHDWRLDKYRKSGKTLVTCPTCETEYASGGVGVHWSRSDCSYPTPNEYQHEVLTGVLMGDGTCFESGGNNPRFKVAMITEPFLAWLADLFGPMVSEATESKYNDGESSIWTLRFRSAPYLNEYLDWYGSGEKRFPENLELSPTIAKMWYVCDGGISKGEQKKWNRIQFSVSNEKDRGDYLCRLFNEHGFDPTLSHHTLRFTTDESKRLLEWMGDPPPGFGYKWEL